MSLGQGGVGTEDDEFGPLDFGDADDRSPGEREADDRFAGHVDPEDMLARIRPRAVHSPDGSFTVLARDGKDPAVEVTVRELAETPGLRWAFADAFAQRAPALAAISVKTEAASMAKFVAFLRTRELLHIKPRHVTNELLDDYKSWLDAFRTPPRVTGRKNMTPTGAFAQEGGRKLSKSTKRSYVQIVLLCMRIIRQSRSIPFEVRHDLDLYRRNDWARLGHRSAATRILTRPQLKHLVRLCRREVAEITARLEAGWAVMEGDDDPFSETRIERALAVEVARLSSVIDCIPPKQGELRHLLGERAGEFRRLLDLPSKDYDAALALRYPSPRLLIPFIILFAIHYRFNTSVLFGLTKSDFSKQPSPHGARLVAQKFKNRAGRMQVASWPITKDVFNPAVMIETITRWTALVRPHVREGHGNKLFLMRMANGNPASFDGHRQGRQGFLRFLDDYRQELGTAFTLKMIRPSVINLVHHLFDGDLLATAEAGQHQVQTMVDHYLSDGARKLNDEALVPAVHMLNGWVGSNGLVDGREDKRGGSVAAATPGFGCNDRYGSTMPGQRPQTMCTAYGMCGSCALKTVEVSSPHAFALVVKLREALRRSRPRMPAESWIARWSGILDDLENKIWWQFPQHIRDAADLDIPDLPTVE